MSELGAHWASEGTKYEGDYSVRLNAAIPTESPQALPRMLATLPALIHYRSSAR